MKVNPTDLLVNGGSYIAKFKKDTSMSDALKKVLFTTSIDSNGNGQINLRDLNNGYIYLMTAQDGTILAKALAVNSSLSFTHSEDGVDVNTKYNLYEVNGIAIDDIVLGNNISTIASDKRSDASSCYVPAVLKNYSASVDASALTSGNTDVAKVTIKPTSVDYEYAIYDGGSIVSEWKVGAVSGITFEGLKAGKTYKVVTKKCSTGVETTGTGTNIYLDTLYNLTSNAYVVTVVNGTVNGANTAIIDSGQQVTIEANAKDFDKWLVPVGSVALADASSQTTTFTMPSKNVIVIAKKTVPDTNKIKVTSTQYGMSDYNVYMDSSDEMGIINTLAGAPEVYLSNHNFNIRYNVTYNKDILTFDEQTALESAGGAANGVAARGAVAIDVDFYIYLDNKRFDSNAFNP